MDQRVQPVRPDPRRPARLQGEGQGCEGEALPRAVPVQRQALGVRCPRQLPEGTQGGLGVSSAEVGSAQCESDDAAGHRRQYRQHGAEHPLEGPHLGP